MGWVFWRNVQWIQRNNRQIRENVERETETEWGRKQIDRQRGDGWEQKQIDRQTDRENRKRKGENGKKKTRRNEQIEKSERDTPTYRVDRQSNTQWATFVGPPMKCPQWEVWDTTQTSQHLRNSSPPPKKNPKITKVKKSVLSFCKFYICSTGLKYCINSLLYWNKVHLDSISRYGWQCIHFILKEIFLILLTKNFLPKLSQFLLWLHC